MPRPRLRPSLRLGIDVGGTNTDAVLMDGDLVVAWHKVATGPDITDAIVAAVEGLRDGSIDPLFKLLSNRWRHNSQKAGHG